MIPWLKSFQALLYDETAFRRAGRALIFLLGASMHNGVIPGLDGAKSWWLGPLVSAAALYIGAGDKTPADLVELAERMRKPIQAPTKAPGE